MKLSSIILASAIMLTSCSAFADVIVQFGEGSGKVDYINNVKYPSIQDPVPFGPMSFRLVEDKLCLIDSVGGKLMLFNRKDGKLISEFSVLPEGVKKSYTEDVYVNPTTKKEEKFPSLNTLVEDFAPVVDEVGTVQAWWLADSHSRKLVKYSKDGKKLAEIENKEFIQFNRIEVGAAGNVFVADSGARSIFAFDADGRFLYKTNWEWTGMSVGSEDKLYRLAYEPEAQKHNLVATGLDGKVVSATVLETEPMFNAKLWWVDEAKGECLVTYTPAGEFKGYFEVIRLGLDGNILGRDMINAAYGMNRIIDYQNGEMYLGKADYRVAPEGSLEIVSYSMPVEEKAAEEGAAEDNAAEEKTGEEKK